MLERAVVVSSVLVFVLVVVLVVVVHIRNTEDQPAVTPVPAVEVSGLVVYRKYAVAPNADATGWQLVSDTGDTAYLLKNPPAEIVSKCGMCKFKVRMKLRVLGERSSSPRYEAEVVKVLYLKEELCDH